MKDQSPEYKKGYQSAMRHMRDIRNMYSKQAIRQKQNLSHKIRHVLLKNQAAPEIINEIKKITSE